VKHESLIGWRGDGDEGIKVVHFIPIGVAHLLAIGDYDARREMAYLWFMIKGSWLRIY